MDESIAISGNLSRVKIGETVYMGRNISRDLTDRINERAIELAKYDLTEQEILLQIMKEFANGSTHDLAREDWGDTTGEYDEAGNQTDAVPDSGKPDGYVDDTNYVATGAKINSEPYPTNLEPAINQRNIPEEAFYPHEISLYETRSNERHDMPDILKKANKEDQPYIPVRIINDDLEMKVPENEQIEDLADEEGEPDKLYIELPEEEISLTETTTEPRLARFMYLEKNNCKICKPFDQKVFDLNDTVHIPIIPSLGLGYTTTHPNCLCQYKELKTSKKKISTLNKKQQKNSTAIIRDIGRQAKKGKLHTVHADGHMSKRTRKTNPIYESIRIREAVTGIKKDFQWLTESYISRLKKVSQKEGGKWLIIRASEETITDHRSEGEPYRRKLSGMELFATTRTSIGKDMDINHYGRDYATGGKIVDAEYDPSLGQSQMLVLERDEEILDAIKDGTIDAVSINGGAPRESNIECGSDECFVVPKGVVLGEDDGIALTYVVTSPNGMYWKGKHVPNAEPGVKTTKIEIL
jgi:hypothetical protein